MLSGRYKTEEDLQRYILRNGVKKYWNAKALRIIEALDKFAGKHGVQQATVALAWLIAQPNMGSAIANVHNVAQLVPLLDAPDIELDINDLKLLDIASKPIS